ncbi:hypothetical protein [Bifidobacterium choloepi]|uniref:hypothetical protein n=1 Tax=Bifidobacterium choloepi TaxID=2614131 RepID=UPI0018C8AF1C|nr:hypothetical protein [Bifidobacterium choloepi]
MTTRHDGGQVRLTESQQAAIDELTSAPKYAGDSKIRTFLRLPWRQKPAYFKTHFLLPLVAALVVAGLAAFLVFKFLVPSPRPALYVAVLDDALPIGSAQTLQSEYSAKLGADVTVDDYFDMSDDGLSKLQTMISNKQIDVVIAPKDTFAELAGYGYFGNVVELLDAASSDSADDSSASATSQDQSSSDESSQQDESSQTNAALQTYAVSFAGYSDDDQYDSYDQSGSGKGESLPYGLALEHAASWTALDDASTTAIAGIVANVDDASVSLDFLDYLYAAPAATSPANDSATTQAQD